jgi:hypothetical protein
VDPELIPFAIKPRLYAGELNGGIIEISQDGGLGGHVHGQIVMGALPTIVLGFVASCAFLTAAKGRFSVV